MLSDGVGSGLDLILDYRTPEEIGVQLALGSYQISRTEYDYGYTDARPLDVGLAFLKRVMSTPKNSDPRYRSFYALGMGTVGVSEPRYGEPAYDDERPVYRVFSIEGGRETLTRTGRTFVSTALHFGAPDGLGSGIVFRFGMLFGH